MPLGTIYRSPADNYLTSIYKDVFNDVGLSRHPCLQDGGPVCGIAPSHPAISGIVHFSFETPHTNMRGSSVQTQLACQCMSSDCTNIATVAIRRPPSGRAFSIDGDNGSCTYQQVVPTSEGGAAAAAAAVGGPPTLHSCASALMHIDAVRGEPVGPFPQEQFVYNVTRFGRNSWSANGYRNGFEKEPSPPPLLPNASTVAVTEPSLAAATAALPRFTPVTTADGPHAEVCGALGSTLGLAAAFHASAQDAAATGSDYDSFLDEPPVLLSDTDIAMTVCGAILGVVAVLSLFRATWSMQKLRWMPKLLTKYIPRGRRDELNHDLAVAQAAVICFGLVLFGLETSALHVALVSEIAAARWRGAFVHLDLTLVSRGPTDVLAFSNLDSSGILFIATSLIGVAQYQSTRQTITFVLVVVLDVIVLAAVAVQVVHWVVSARRVDAAVAASPNDSQGGGGTTARRRGGSRRGRGRRRR
ncbi:hypothetical protein BU14_0058s0002 [Porphyra umbilicalis]|uniref:Uncharacterized protein n=1 Tax=Porphyra umbilicalis TaxID=2786 RepID=A0A1X6PGV2_PORUM|nr:hypothetical protein BU14_0058s0002 [Porphyra umbilicalis]OSX80091.1 hypothetical protein BU14_0058s0002 [Porphyra umbilicalis]|eukprot:OSX80090.1 hypothetical protein BU14_0058s0002 [Porphyra umbilicalis]